MNRNLGGLEVLERKNAALKHAKVSIKPFLSGDDNMGLRKYGLVLFDETIQKDGIMCLTNEAGNVKTYVTGLNPDTEAISKLGKDEKQAKINHIKKTVTLLENKLASNYEITIDNCLEGTDSEFWKRVKTFRSVVPDTFDTKGNRNPTFWDSIVIGVSNDGKVLDLNDANDLLIYEVISAGGSCLIAPSLTAAMEGGYKFYLDKREASDRIKISGKRLRNQAGNALEDMYNKDASKLFYVTKLVSEDSLFLHQGKGATTNDTLYDEATNFLDGLGMLRDKDEASEKFLKYAKMEMAELVIRTIIKDCSAMMVIAPKGGQLQYITENGFNIPLGKEIEDVVLFLQNPINESIFTKLLHKAESEWKKL